jgi:cysteine synthase
MRYESLLQSIGHTPVVRLRSRAGAAKLYAKLELTNPAGGHKDRFARHVIQKARATGQLKEGGVIIETSSGTLGQGLAMVGRSLGHEVHIVTDPRTDAMTLAKLWALGAVVHVVDQPNANGWQGARLERTEQLVAQTPGAFWPRQYSNPENPESYAAVAEELTADLGRVDALVAPVGSGGLLCGTARALKAVNPNLKAVAVDVVGSIIFDQPLNAKRLLNGVGNSIVPPNVDRSVIDQVHWVNDQEGFGATLQLARHEQIIAGGSSGAAYLVADWVARCLPAEHTVAVLLPDRGDRYYKTVYNPAFLSDNGLRPDHLPDAPRQVAFGTPVTEWSYAHLPHS